MANHKTEKWNILPAQRYKEMFQNPIVWNEYPPVLEFTDQEHEQGRTILREMGLEPGEYICFHTRESAYALSYLPQLIASRRPKKSSSPNVASPEESVSKLEKSLLQRYRHSDPLVYGKAMKSLANRGVKSVRVGSVVAGKLEISEPYVVDYAGNFRSQLGDLGDFQTYT
jgi:hypothetical protein